MRGKVWLVGCAVRVCGTAWGVWGVGVWMCVGVLWCGCVGVGPVWVRGEFGCVGM